MWCGDWSPVLWSVHHQSIMSGDPEPRTTARCHGVPELAPRRSAPQASTGPPGTPLASRPDVSRVALAPYSCMRYARCPQGPKRSAPAPNGPLSCVHHPSRHSDQVETRLARLISSSDGPAPAELRLMLRGPPCVGRHGAYLAEPASLAALESAEQRVAGADRNATQQGAELRGKKEEEAKE